MSIHKSKLVFIVDDDEMVQTALEDYITRKTGWSVQCYGTGEDCINHLKD